MQVTTRIVNTGLATTQMLVLYPLVNRNVARRNPVVIGYNLYDKNRIGHNNLVNI